jgi:hypothetical protein
LVALYAFPKWNEAEKVFDNFEELEIGFAEGTVHPKGLKDGY